MIFNIPPPDLQIDFSARLVKARQEFLQDALLKTVAGSDIWVLDEEAHIYVHNEALRTLAGCGLRAELLFALPEILTSNPRLLGYYRLLLGFSRKEFYSAQFGLSSTYYANMEDCGELSNRIKDTIPELCLSLNRSAEVLLRNLTKDSITERHLDNLSLLTFGPQLRGGRNVRIGASAVKHVFDAIEQIVGHHAIEITDQLIRLTDATGREINIRFSSDPDIELVTVNPKTRLDSPLLAVEVKGGEDRSNAHNRLGEAEKSHLKARQKGHTDLWTITNVAGLSEEDKRAESPTTTAFFDLSDIVRGRGDEYEEFRERLLQKLRLPT